MVFCDQFVLFRTFDYSWKHVPNKLLINSNINEVIRAVLNFFFFFYEKISHARTKGAKSTKSTKKHQKHQKHQKAQRRNQAKAQNANKRISDYFPLRCFLGAFFIFVRL